MYKQITLGGVKMKKLVFAVLLVALCSLMLFGCEVVKLGVTAVKVTKGLYDAGSGKSQKPQELRYDAAIHRYYILDENGRRVYE